MRATQFVAAKWIKSKGEWNEPRNLDVGNVSARPSSHGAMLPIHESLRENLKGEAKTMMIYLTVAVAAFLFVYLVVALIRPEWF